MDTMAFGTDAIVSRQLELLSDIFRENSRNVVKLSHDSLFAVKIFIDFSEN